jgi:predicted Zn-dependent protease
VFGSNDVLNVGSGAVFGISGSSDTAYATGATAYVNTGSTNDTITGNSNNINVASGLTFAINGSYDTVNTGNATLSISNNLVGVMIYANNSTITEGNNDTVDVIGSGDTIIQGTGDTNLGVGGSNSTNGGGQDFVSNAASLATFSQALNVVAQDDLNSSGDSNAAATAQTSAFQAAVTAQMAADFGAILSPEYEGAAWAPTASTTTPSTTDLSTTGTASSSTVVTWSFANSPGTANDPFSSYIGAQYQATIEAAINAWSAVSGLTFVEVPDSATTDVRIGWGDFQTATSGVIGYTDFQQTNGAIQQGASVRLEDPMETSLTTDPAGSLVYSGTNTTLYQVALHEIGRAIGLSDNADPNSVMFGTASSSNQTLDQTDIDGAQALYGTPTDPINSTTALAELQQIYVNSSTTQTAANTQLSLSQLIQAMATFAPQQSATTPTVVAAQSNASQQQIAASTGH